MNSLPYGALSPAEVQKLKVSAGHRVRNKKIKEVLGSYDRAS